MQGSRPERIGDQIRVETSELLMREVKDPGVGFITLTHVRVTPDLQLARIYYTVLGDAASRKRTADALTRATPFLRRRIGQRLSLRRVPEIQFVFDESIEREARIEQLFQEIRDAGRLDVASLDDDPDGK